MWQKVNSFGQLVMWDGDAMDNLWSSPTNWDTDAVPTALNSVRIPTGDSVHINASSFAQSIRLNNNAILHISTADLIIDGSASQGIFFTRNGKLTLTEDANVIIRNTTTGGMRANHVGPPSGPAIIEIKNSGSLSIGPRIPVNGITAAGRSRIQFDNCGTLNIGPGISNDGMVADVGVARINFTNQNSAIVNIDSVGADGINLENMSEFINSGTLNIRNSENQAIDLDMQYQFTNTLTGIINIDGVFNEEAIDVARSCFDNLGIINISNVESEDGIDIEANGHFRNEGILNISLTSADINDEAIDVYGPSLFANFECAVVNIRSSHAIEVSNVGSRFRNRGVLTTVFTGTNPNNGGFFNSESVNIVTTTGIFNLSPRALNMGMGAPVPPNNTILSGPLPATAAVMAKVNNPSFPGSYDPIISPIEISDTLGSPTMFTIEYNNKSILAGFTNIISMPLSEANYIIPALTPHGLYGGSITFTNDNMCS